MKVFKVEIVEFWHGSFGDEFTEVHNTRLFLNEQDAKDCLSAYKQLLGTNDYRFEMYPVEVESQFKNDLL